jgi:hypothetical protein
MGSKREAMMAVASDVLELNPMMDTNRSDTMSKRGEKTSSHAAGHSMLKARIDFAFWAYAITIDNNDVRLLCTFNCFRTVTTAW